MSDGGVRIEEYTEEGVVVSFRTTTTIPWGEIDIPTDGIESQFE